MVDDEPQVVSKIINGKLVTIDQVRSAVETVLKRLRVIGDTGYDEGGYVDADLSKEDIDDFVDEVVARLAFLDVDDAGRNL